MKRLLFGALALALASSCRNIVGGENAPDLRPFTIAFTTKCTDVVCGGTVIAPRWVLTAAHCVGGNRVVPGTIAAIGDDTAPICGTQYEVESVFPHPDYKGTDNDIALVSLTTPVAGTTGIPCGGRVVDGENVTMAGRGLDLSGAQTKTLMSIVLMVQNQCPPPSSPTKRCAAPVGGDDHHVAPGDSGGPVLVQSGGGWQLAGVITDDDDDISAFTPVAAYAGWINQTMQGASWPCN